MLWQELTSPEIDRLDRDLPVLIPLASCEQHGRHLPVFTDTLETEAIAARVEKLRSDRLVALPTLWLGASHHHIDFPGTLSLPPAAYAGMIQHLTRCLLQHGFRRLFFLNGHGGNVVPASQALTDLIATDDRADAASIAFSSWWRVASAVLAPERHGMKTPNSTHACEYETSLVLALRDDLVKLAEIDPNHLEVQRPWVTAPWTGKVEGFHRFHRWTSSGHMGDPTAATAEKGHSILQAVTDEVVKFIDDFSKWPPMNKIGPQERP